MNKAQERKRRLTGSYEKTGSICCEQDTDPSLHIVVVLEVQPFDKSKGQDGDDKSV